MYVSDLHVKVSSHELVQLNLTVVFVPVKNNNNNNYKTETEKDGSRAATKSQLVGLPACLLASQPD